ncbi:hypothetical protein AMECASPLE_023325 [Ameca splendens]|uniref:Uncharacterized protein n=1 Tax=Ameca splendens TaxID=208324 RepID=A0ABV0Y4B3_9TELE
MAGTVIVLTADLTHMQKNTQRNSKQFWKFIARILEQSLFQKGYSVQGGLDLPGRWQMSLEIQGGLFWESTRNFRGPSKQIVGGWIGCMQARKEYRRTDSQLEPGSSEAGCDKPSD